MRKINCEFCGGVDHHTLGCDPARRAELADRATPKPAQDQPVAIEPDIFRSKLFQQFLKQGFWHAHHLDLVWRFNGEDVREEADWLKDVWYRFIRAAPASPAVQNAVPEGLVKEWLETVNACADPAGYGVTYGLCGMLKQACALIAAQAEELQAAKDEESKYRLTSRATVIALTEALNAERAAKEQAEAALAAATTRAEGLAELLHQVMVEGVEHNTNKYAVVQMSHALRAEIRATLDAAQGEPK